MRDYFSSDFQSADERFVSACTGAGVDVIRHQHPLVGPDGEDIAALSAVIGRPDARKLIVLISGTHGVEVLCGSGCQTGFVEERSWQHLDDDTAVLMIHALNCWGAAFSRRNNEDNVDLNRNFVDFGKPRPENSGYEAIHDALSCAQYRGPARTEANEVLANYAKTHGVNKYVAAIMGGQYAHSDGMAYGGSEATWSNKLLKSILAPFASTAERAAIVEYHSGLGPYGYGTAVTMQTGAELERIKSAYGRWVEAPNERGDAGNNQYFKARGHTTEGFQQALPETELSAIVLEYGTYPPQTSLPTLIDDHWLTHHGELKSPEGQLIKRQLVELHYPDDPDWRQAVWDRSRQVIGQTRRILD